MTKKALLACAAALAIAAPSITYAEVVFNVAAFSDYTTAASRRPA